jgi:transposase-like protein
MTKRTRRTHSAARKAKVTTAAVKGDRTLAELTQQFDAHPNQTTEWKRQMQKRAADVFGARGMASGESLVDYAGRTRSDAMHSTSTGYEL